ncbi:hypothetical protein PIB30_095357, partial [Stylosanthes scabra]|nr:hypothetical protein [Stylosanthes scabra]
MRGWRNNSIANLSLRLSGVGSALNLLQLGGRNISPLMRMHLRLFFVSISLHNH